MVDDNTVNRAVAKGMLDSLKCDVDMVINGLEAVSASAAKAYDMILMDCNMPEMDGLEAAARIRSREKASSAPRVPIIALTGNAEPGSRENCINAGMDDFLAKPYSCAALAQVIARRVSRRTESCPIL